MITISEKAERIIRKLGSQEQFVQIVVKSGGCAGMTYDANLVSDKEGYEKIVYQEEGITVITDEVSLPYLQGLTIDYSEDLISAGFRFNNSSNESSCGCGGSFSVSGLPQTEIGGMSCDT